VNDSDLYDPRPEPLVPPDCDLRGFSGFMLDVDRLLASELVAIGKPDECWAAVMLWCRAWKQTPAGSLPNDERVLAAFSGAGSRWTKVRSMALRGFILCKDGRLYHHVLAEQVMSAWGKRQTYRNDQERLRKWRENKKRNGHGNGAVSGHETGDETRFNGISDGVSSDDGNGSETRRQGQGQGQGQGERKKESPPTPQRGADQGRGSRLPQEWNPGDAGWEYAVKLGLDPKRVLEKFRNYWIAQPGVKGRKVDWTATWRNWCLTESERSGRSPGPVAAVVHHDPITGVELPGWNF
jgi:Protein of unknown function (DUF1376)